MEKTLDGLNPEKIRQLRLTLEKVAEGSSG